MSIGSSSSSASSASSSSSSVGLNKTPSTSYVSRRDKLRLKSGFLGQLSKKSSHQITLPCDRDLNNELEYYESLNATDVDETMLGQIKRPLNFFKKQCDDLPKLARVARIIMCVPSTSVPSESLFSIAEKRFKKPARSDEFKHAKLPKV